MIENFRPVKPLSMNGVEYAELSPSGLCLFMDIDKEDFNTFNVAEARALRDWLTAALPADGSGDANG
jgi:hypothetical protein